jgi:hypothetical protein
VTEMPTMDSAVVPVPEPGTIALLAAGALVASLALRRWKR